MNIKESMHGQGHVNPGTHAHLKVLNKMNKCIAFTNKTAFNNVEPRWAICQGELFEYTGDPRSIQAQEHGSLSESPGENSYFNKDLALVRRHNDAVNQGYSTPLISDLIST